MTYGIPLFPPFPPVFIGVHPWLPPSFPVHLLFSCNFPVFLRNDCFSWPPSVLIRVHPWLVSSASFRMRIQTAVCAYRSAKRSRTVSRAWFRST